MRHERHPDHPGAIATYITGDGRALPLWTEDDIAYSYEVIAHLQARGALTKPGAVAA